jgi:hypothetical protein
MRRRPLQFSYHDAIINLHGPAHSGRRAAPVQRIGADVNDDLAGLSGKSKLSITFIFMGVWRLFY